MSDATRRQWPAALLFLAGSIKAGLAMEDALALLRREAPEPLKSHLADRERGLARWAPFVARVERLMEGDELALPRAALLFAHRAGGQAAPVLEQCAQTLQIQLETEARLRALTAQNRLSAWVVGLAPTGLLAAFALFAPDYIAPLFQTGQGAAALALAAVLVALGLTLVSRMARLE